jgi:hypothetical protein
MLRNCLLSVVIVGCLASVPTRRAAADGPGPSEAIDKAVVAKLRAAETDKASLHKAYATFFRRLHLDLRGTIPVAEELRTFLAADGSKRAATVEEMLTDAAKEHGWSKDRQQQIRAGLLASLLRLDQ